MSKILIPSSHAHDWKRFLADPDKQWKRGYSAMATALSWEAAADLPAEIKRLFDDEADLLLAIPEHKVPLPGGQRESQCDVFALLRSRGETIAMAVEAKVNEPFGPTIGEWMANASAGKIERLAFICERLGVASPPPDHLRYQLFHRTAAAIVEAERFKTDRAAMIVQSFAQDHRWFEDFEAFAAMLDLSARPDAASTMTLPSGRRLTLGWAVGSSDYL